RLQARVVWLLPYGASFILFALTKRYRNTIEKKLQ
ncbi:MAG: hypothetical protein RL362_497, partial [Bacteroidota bacterium]